MRSLGTPLIGLALCSVLWGCAAFDGVAPRDIELSDLAAPDAPGARESFDGGRRGDSAGVGEPAQRRAREPDPAPPARPRPDGPNMDVYRSRSCDSALRSVADDDAMSPRTRALAGQVLRCDAENGHYDLRHAPCPLFASADDDRLVDTAIQELRASAPACDAPPG